MVMDTRRIHYSTVDENRRKTTKTDENRRIVGADKMLSFMNKLREFFRSRGEFFEPADSRLLELGSELQTKPSRPRIQGRLGTLSSHT